MRFINMLPYREEEENRLIVLHVLSVFASLFLLFAVMFSINSYETSATDEMKSELSSVRGQNTNMKKRIGRVRNLDELKSTVTKKLSLVDSLQSNRFQVFVHLTEIANIIPDSVKIVNVNEQNGGWSIDGRGYSNNDIADFARLLERSDFFHDVTLNNVNRNKNGMRTFRITIKNTNIAKRSKS